MHVNPTIRRCCHLALIFSFVFGFLGILRGSRAQAQTRVNDRDMEALMRNLHDDAKSFRPRFNDAIHKSTIRKTSQERDAKAMSATFDRQTVEFLDRFKRHRSGEAEFQTVMNTAEQLDGVVTSVDLGPSITAQWQKIRTELHQIASAYGVPARFHGDSEAMSSNDEKRYMTSDAGTCLQTAGEVKANQLVNECLQVSSGTHPPCNVQNSCAMIISEIKRSCTMLGDSSPGFCAEYR
ncbi:MAG: hypothetical protein H0U76_04460 [Ktedonobacteraceae bacterium]|nr:hypothetical protein [Ktedonobacteraceae bacterium]